MSQARQIDVLWFERKPRPFPKFAFEVETTPEFRRALLRLYQLCDFDTALYIVADEAKRPLFEKRLQDEPFYALRHRFVFRSFEEVFRLYQLQVQLSEEQSRFFAEHLRPRW